MNYSQELKNAMEWLAAKPDTLFIGQSVGCPGTSIYASVKDIDPAKRLEFPVAEELQMGVSIGLSLEGFCPVSIFPRWNFLLLAANQLVNHLDRLPLYSEYMPKVIIRTVVGASRPLDPGPQHCDDFHHRFNEMLQTVAQTRLDADCWIRVAYEQAYSRSHSTILTEIGELARCSS